MDLPIDPSTCSSQLSDSFGFLSSQTNAVVNMQSFTVYCDEEGIGVTKNLKLLRGSERDDNEVLLRNPCFASVYGELLNEEEKTVKRMEKLNRLDTIAEENEAYMNRMRERFAHFNIVGEEDKGVYEYSDSYSYSESYYSSEDSSSSSWESENERIVKIPPHIEQVESSEESE
ncbi:hypothetical protein WA588_001250, partial [Blastocystis sp. NMH]